MLRKLMTSRKYNPLIIGVMALFAGIIVSWFGQIATTSNLGSSAIPQARAELIDRVGKCGPGQNNSGGLVIKAVSESGPSGRPETFSVTFDVYKDVAAPDGIYSYTIKKQAFFCPVHTGQTDDGTPLSGEGHCVMRRYYNGELNQFVNYADITETFTRDFSSNTRYSHSIVSNPGWSSCGMYQSDAWFTDVLLPGTTLPVRCSDEIGQNLAAAWVRRSTDCQLNAICNGAISYSPAPIVPNQPVILRMNGAISPLFIDGSIMSPKIVYRTTDLNGNPAEPDWQRGCAWGDRNCTVSASYTSQLTSNNLLTSQGFIRIDQDSKYFECKPNEGWQCRNKSDGSPCSGPVDPNLALNRLPSVVGSTCNNSCIGSQGVVGPTATPSPSHIPTPTPTLTPTGTVPPSPTPTPTGTVPPSPTPTRTPTPTLTPTGTVPPSPTPTNTPTVTPVPPTATPTPPYCPAAPLVTDRTTQWVQNNSQVQISWNLQQPSSVIDYEIWNISNGTLDPQNPGAYYLQKLATLPATALNYVTTNVNSLSTRRFLIRAVTKRNAQNEAACYNQWSLCALPLVANRAVEYLGNSNFKFTWNPTQAPIIKYEIWLIDDSIGSQNYYVYKLADNIATNATSHSVTIPFEYRNQTGYRFLIRAVNRTENNEPVCYDQWALGYIFPSATATPTPTATATPTPTGTLTPTPTGTLTPTPTATVTPTPTSTLTPTPTPTGTLTPTPTGTLTPTPTQHPTIIVYHNGQPLPPHQPINTGTGAGAAVASVSMVLTGLGWFIRQRFLLG